MQNSHDESPSSPSVEATLRSLHIRPIHPEDWHRLQLFHARLSPLTAEERFHTSNPHVSDAVAHQFAAVDGKDDVGLVATTGTRGKIIGYAMYSRMSPTTAEIAFVIEDPYQHHGVGHKLLQHMRELALENGITEFVAEVLADNFAAVHLVREAGASTVTTESGDLVVHADLRAPSQPA